MSNPLFMNRLKVESRWGEGLGSVSCPTRKVAVLQGMTGPLRELDGEGLRGALGMTFSRGRFWA